MYLAAEEALINTRESSSHRLCFLTNNNYNWRVGEISELFLVVVVVLFVWFVFVCFSLNKLNFGKKKKERKKMLLLCHTLTIWTGVMEAAMFFLIDPTLLVEVD